MKYLLIIMLSVSSYAINLSQNAQDGEEIYLESNCQRCHNSGSNYDAKVDAVKTHFELKKWVSSCMSFFNHSWFPQEKKDVVKYLNEIYYKIDLQKTQ